MIMSVNLFAIKNEKLLCNILVNEYYLKSIWMITTVTVVIFSFPEAIWLASCCNMMPADTSRLASVCQYCLRVLSSVELVCIQCIPGTMLTFVNFVVFNSGSLLRCFTHILQGCLTDTGAIHMMIVPVSVKQPWRIWVKHLMNLQYTVDITIMKQSTTKPRPYFMGYTDSVCQQALPQGHIGGVNA